MPRGPCGTSLDSLQPVGAVSGPPSPTGDPSPNHSRSCPSLKSTCYEGHKPCPAHLGEHECVAAVAGLVPRGPGGVGLQLVLGQRHDLCVGDGGWVGWEGEVGGKRRKLCKLNAKMQGAQRAGHHGVHRLSPQARLQGSAECTTAVAYRHGAGVQVQGVHEQAGEVSPLNDFRHEGRASGAARRPVG